MTASGSVIDWLLDSDPSIRWQVMRDLLDLPESEWKAERAKVEAEGWGARLLSAEDEDGQWAGGAFFPRDFDVRELQELGHPSRWRYDVLRALDYFRSAAALTGAAPDPRLGEAVDHVRSRRLEDGTWPLDWNPAGRVWFDVEDGAGKPSRWVTLRAMRVLSWWEGSGSSLGSG